MVSEQTTMNEAGLTTLTRSRGSDDDDSLGSRMLLEAAEGPTEVSAKQHLIDGFVDNLLVRMELEETTAVHMMKVCAFMILESSSQLQAFNEEIHEGWDDQISDVVARQKWMCRLGYSPSAWMSLWWRLLRWKSTCC